MRCVRQESHRAQSARKAITLHLIRCVGRGARACPYAVAESVYAAANPQRSCVFQETSVIQGNGVIQGSFFLGADATSCDKGALVGNAFSGNVVNPKDWYETMGFKERGFAVRSFIVSSCATFHCRRDGSRSGTMAHVCAKQAAQNTAWSVGIVLL